MAIALETINAVSRDVIREHGRGLELVGVTKMGKDSERVEILVTIGGCHQEPCRFVIDVSRVDDEVFEREFRAKLNDAVVKHAASQ